MGASDDLSKMAEEVKRKIVFQAIYIIQSKRRLVTCVFTAALAKASPSPALVIDPCEPALKARKPKSRMRNPRQQKGIEWPEIPPVFVHRSVLGIYLGCLVMEVGVVWGTAFKNLAPRMTQPGRERTAPAR